MVRYFPKFIPDCCLTSLLSIAVIVMLPWYTSLGIRFTVAPFSILGVAIAIFTGFRNNACYSRYVEARLLWGQLMIAARSLFREVKTPCRMINILESLSACKSRLLTVCV